MRLEALVSRDTCCSLVVYHNSSDISYLIYFFRTFRKCTYIVIIGGGQNENKGGQMDFMNWKVEACKNGSCFYVSEYQLFIMQTFGLK